MVENRNFLFNGQLQEDLCRGVIAVIVNITFAHRLEHQGDGVFARRKCTKILVFQHKHSVRAVLDQRVIGKLTNFFRAVINRKD